MEFTSIPINAMKLFSSINNFALNEFALNEWEITHDFIGKT